MKTTTTFAENLDTPVTVTVTENTIVVEYGKEKRTFPGSQGYELVAEEIGSAILHSMACLGKLDHNKKIFP